MNEGKCSIQVIVETPSATFKQAWECRIAPDATEDLTLADEVVQALGPDAYLYLWFLDQAKNEVLLALDERREDGTLVRTYSWKLNREHSGEMRQFKAFAPTGWAGKITLLGNMSLVKTIVVSLQDDLDISD